MQLLPLSYVLVLQFSHNFSYLSIIANNITRAQVIEVNFYLVYFADV
jgi:hypothetical protein